jgi:hypothetical protein
MKKLLLFSVLFTGFAMPMTGHAKGADTLRTVYFSALDAKGTPVTDLTATDLAVKEGGKDRAIASVVAATTPIQVSFLVDDGGTGGFQAAVAQFLETMVGHGQIAIRAFNPQPSVVTDFTEDVGALQKALAAIGPRGRVITGGDQMVDAVAEAATELQRRKAPRAAIVVLTVGGEKAQSNQAESTLNAVRNSGASLSVVHLAGIELGQVLGDGPKRSGGMIQQVAAGVTLGPVLAKVADSLLKQYVLTYTLPDGVKPNERLSLTTSRKGVTLLAPSRVPDK